MTSESPRAAGGEALAAVDDRDGPGLVDAARFLYRGRVRLAVRFIVLLGIGTVALLAWYLLSPTTVQGTLALGFRGIEKHEYPSGRRFSVEDLRGPAVLAAALRDAGVPADQLDVRRFSAGVFVTSIVPADVQSRWRKQERDGLRKDEYFPNEFLVALQLRGFGTAQQLRLFDALVKSYQERVKHEQTASLSFVGGGWTTSYETLAAKYDFWDIPALFAETFKSLDRELSRLIVEALQYPDAKYHLGFRDIARELHNWQTIRLSALEALTYQGRLVRNKDLTLQRMQHRLEDIDIQIKQKTQEANEGLRLLGLIDRPNALIAGRLSGDKGVPVVDAGALEKLLKNDYVAPVVAKISRLQSEAQELEAERGRLRKHADYLPRATNVDLAQLPAGYRELVQTLSSELALIVTNYNRLLDDYLAASVTSLVAVTQSPIAIRGIFSARMAAVLVAALVVLSLFLAVVAMSVEHLVQTVKATTGGPPRSTG